MYNKINSQRGIDEPGGADPAQSRWLSSLIIKQLRGTRDIERRTSTILLLFRYIRFKKMTINDSWWIYSFHYSIFSNGLQRIMVQKIYRFDKLFSILPYVTRSKGEALELPLSPSTLPFQRIFQVFDQHELIGFLQRLLFARSSPPSSRPRPGTWGHEQHGVTGVCPSSLSNLFYTLFGPRVY